MELTQAQALAYLGHFLWPFLRVTGLMLTAPIIGSTMVPSTVKATLAAGYGFALAGWLHNLPPYPADPLIAIYIGLVEIAYGAMMGMVMQIVITSVACAGEIAGLSMSLSFAQLQFQEAGGSTPVLYDIMLWAGIIGFMVAGGPEWTFVALARSFQNGIGISGFNSVTQLAGMGEVLFQAAVGLALPVMAVTLCINLTIGITTVFAPTMNLLSIGFPMLILAGLWVISDSVLYSGHTFHWLMKIGTGIVAGMAGG
jgi:flagellar biosynthetic protein FliR